MAYYYPYRQVLLQSQTASSSSSIAFTSLINSNFSVYKVQFRNIISSSDLATMRITFSTDNGSTYLNTNYAYEFQTVTSAGVYSRNGGAAQANSQLCPVSNGASSGVNGFLMLYDLNSATYSAKTLSQLSFYDVTNSLMKIVNGPALNTGTTAINAIKFDMSAGNIASGTFTLFGVSEP